MAVLQYPVLLMVSIQKLKSVHICLLTGALLQTSMQLMDTCNWLVEVGILQEVTNPIKLTSKSRGTVDEPAYYYGGE